MLILIVVTLASVLVVVTRVAIFVVVALVFILVVVAIELLVLILLMITLGSVCIARVPCVTVFVFGTICRWAVVAVIVRIQVVATAAATTPAAAYTVADVTSTTAVALTTVILAHHIAATLVRTFPVMSVALVLGLENPDHLGADGSLRQEPIYNLSSHPFVEYE